MTKLSEQDLQHVSGGVTGFARNERPDSGNSDALKPAEEQADSEAK